MGKLKSEYTTRHILQVFKIKMEKCRDWHSKGFIEATVPSPGQGQKAEYTIEDLYGIALFIKLTEKGFKRNLAAEIVKSTRAKGQGLLSVAEFVLYQSIRKEGKLEVKPTYLSGGDYAIHLSPKKIGIEAIGFDHSENNHPVEDNEIWEDVFVINLIYLRHGVDKALAKMA